MPSVGKVPCEIFCGSSFQRDSDVDLLEPREAFHVISIGPEEDDVRLQNEQIELRAFDKG